MVYRLSRIDRRTRSYDLAAVLGRPVPAGVTGVAVALLAPRGAPSGSTVWTAAEYDDGMFAVLLAGPDADPTGALVVPADADLWMRVADAPEVDAERVERVTVLGGTGAFPPAPAPGGGVGVTDHGALTGLSDDDHPQYLTNARGDARYYTQAQVATALAGKQATGDYATNTALSDGLATKVNSSTYTAGLALKANTADLAAVAQSGSYNDLANRPTLGTAAAQNASAFDAAGAAAAAQAAAVQRANHTGTQTSASISDLTEAVQDIVGAFFGAGTGATVTYNDNANTITVSATGTDDPEAIRDAIGAAMVGVGNISVTVNDGADTITISTSATVNSTDAALRDRSTHTGTQAASTVTGLATVATSGAYADLSGTPTIPAAYTDEQAQDAAAALLTGGTHTGISFNYVDGSNRVDATVSGGGGTAGFIVPVARVNEWAAHPTSVSSPSAIAYPAGVLDLGPLWLGAGTYDAVAFHVTVAGSTGCVTRVAVYDGGTGGQPGSLLLETSAVDTTSTGLKTITGLSLVIPSGGKLVWAGAVNQGAPTTPASIIVLGLHPMYSVDSTASIQFPRGLCYRSTGTTGSVPATAAAFTREFLHARIGLRRSA